ncbi:oxidoreductase [Aureococcus anophagefferens]|nr:oxidoreductase [Aureococcus anophagefferens]
MAAVQAAVEKFAKATVGEPSEFDCDVVVVGGGCAGLAAARFLMAKGWSCVVVEASDRLGGRVREAAVRCGEDECVAAGAEFVHGGDGNFLLPLLKDAGVALEEASWPDSYWLGGAGALVAAAAADRRPGLKKVHGAFEDVVAAHAPGESLLQYWVRAGVGSADLGVAEAVYANDYGGAASGLGAGRGRVGAAALDARRGLPAAGDGGDAVAGRRRARDGRRRKARLGRRVRVPRRPGRDRARRTDGVMLRARACVVAAPVAALRPRGGDPGVAFVPPLPPDLARAIDALPVANAVKAVVVLDRAVWADETASTCSWASRRATADDVALRRGEATRRFLRQLDDVFGAADDPHPATNACVGSALFDWASEAHARGGYTYPSPGCLPLRAPFREPVDGRLFFAGEHATEGINPCVQGAVDSGFRAGKLAQRRSAARRRRARRRASARGPRATRQVRGPRVKCDLNGWREEAPRKPRNGFDAAVTALPQFDVAIGDSTPLRHSKTSAKFPWNADGAGSPSPRAPGTTAWGPHVDHPRERETMAPGGRRRRPGTRPRP